jgi:peptidoglycan/LPS O-acetylase OafA/YrhL
VKKISIYFPGLNGLRFFAALAVIITHVELLKSQLSIENYWTNMIIFNLGGLGVYFFFVLSGFLITYLLLAEKEQGTISVRKFYLRRILRIWPLYYLIVLLAFFVLPHFEFFHIPWLQSHLYENFWQQLFLFVFMLPNLALAMNPAIPHAGQLWSIGVEEQFYIVWPWVIKKSKSILKHLLVIGLAIILVKILIVFFYKIYPYNKAFTIVKLFLAMSKIECMVIGSIGAYYTFFKKIHADNFIYKKATQLSSIILIPVLIYLTPHFLQDGIHIVFSFLFLIIILNVAFNVNSILTFKHKIFYHLGTISYGIYMFHMVVVVGVIRLFSKIFKDDTNSLTNNFCYYFFSILLTILVSYLSYHYFEKRFLKIKEKYTKISSGKI